MDLGLKDKTIVLAGSQGAIGSAICSMLKAEGANVIGFDIKTGVDLSYRAVVKQEFEQLRETYPRIHGFCASLYGGPDAIAALDVTPGDLEESFRHSFYAVWYPTQAAAKWMIETSGGNIVIISSINSVLGMGEFPYDVAKGAVNRIAPDLATTYGARGLYACSLCLGTIAPTPAWIGREEILANVQQSIPDKRTTTPMEAAQATAFLLSEFGRIFNGSTLIADRGWSLKPAAEWMV